MSENVKLSKEDLTGIFGSTGKYRDLYFPKKKMDILTAPERLDFVRKELNIMGRIDSIHLTMSQLDKVLNHLSEKNARKDFVEIPETYTKSREDFYSYGIDPSSQTSVNERNQYLSSKNRYISNKYNTDNPAILSKEIKSMANYLNALEQAVKDFPNDIHLRDNLSRSRLFFAPEIKRLKVYLREVDYSKVSETDMKEIANVGIKKSDFEKKVQSLDMQERIDLINSKAKELTNKYRCDAIGDTKKEDNPTFKKVLDEKNEKLSIKHGAEEDYDYEDKDDDEENKEKSDMERMLASAEKKGNVIRDKYRCDTGVDGNDKYSCNVVGDTKVAVNTKKTKEDDDDETEEEDENDDEAEEEDDEKDFTKDMAIDYYAEHPEELNITKGQRKLVEALYGEGDFLKVDDEIYYKANNDNTTYRVDLKT